MNESSRFENITAYEGGAFLVGAVGGFVVGLEIDKGTFHAHEAGVAASQVSTLQADANSMAAAQKVLRAQGQESTTAYNILGERIGTDNTQINTIQAHSPVFAGGQEIESMAVAAGVVVATAVLAVALTHKIRRNVYDRRRKSAEGAGFTISA